MGRLLKILIAVVLLVLLLLWCLRNHPPAIESSLTQTTNRVLTEKGRGWATSVLDGRDVILTGMAPTKQDRIAAAKIVSDVKGVRVVDNQITVAPPPAAEVAPAPAPEPEPVLSPFGLRASLSTDVLTLSGIVPNQLQRESIVGFATQQFPNARVVDELRVGSHSPQSWREGLDVGLNQLARLTEGVLQIDAARWTLSGLAQDAGVRDSIATLVDADVPGVFSTELSVEIPATEAQVDQCQNQFNELMASNRILFRTASAEIDGASINLLNQLSEVAARCVAVIEIEGHTDGQGAEADNLLLSQRRADAVREYLLVQGVSEERVIARGYGERQPVGDNSTPSGRAQNRRIEFRVEKIAP